MTSRKKKGLFDRVWAFFASITLAIVLFSLIALTSIVGTVIEQNAGYAKNIKVLTSLVGESLAPGAYRLLDALGFMDMYHSWWFTALLALFCMNLLVCSIERLPRIWRLVTDPMIPLQPNVLRNLGIRREMRVKASAGTAREAVETLLRKEGFRPSTVDQGEGAVQVFGQKGGWARLGVYVVHGSILVIFVGAIIGLRFGFKAGLNLPEGHSSNVVYRYGSGEEIPLGFTLKCNWYETEFYGSSDQPKLFRSELEVFENGRSVLKKWIRVNDPLVYRGITFYQSSYGPVPNPHDGRFVFRFRAPGREPRTLWLRKNVPTTLPGTDIQATVLDFSPALTTNRQTGQLYTYTSSMNNPAVKVRFTRAGKDAFPTGWIWKRWPETGKLPGGLLFEFLHYWGAQYTGLQVRKDPGVWLVYLGCTLMSVALFVAFFVSHRKVWVRIEEGGREGARLLIGASAHRNRVSFEKDLEKMTARLAERLEGGTG